MRSDGTLWLPNGSQVWWGRYHRNGKPQTFNFADGRQRGDDEENLHGVLRQA